MISKVLWTAHEFTLKLGLVFSLSGRTISASGATGPFRAFPKSLSVDFGGLNHPQAQPLPQSLSQQHQQQPGSVGQTTTAVGSSNAQDRYAAVLQLDSVFSDPSSTTGGNYLSLTPLMFWVLHFTWVSLFSATYNTTLNVVLSLLHLDERYLQIKKLDTN